MIPIRPLESRLVTEAMGGDASAVEALVLHYQRKAQAVAHAITVGSAADPEDIVQEAFLQTLRDLPRLRQPECFGRWFLQIVRNVARRALRRAPITQVASALDTQAAAPCESLEQAELRITLWREVSRLPECVRDAIFLYYYDGESVGRVADALGISVGAAKKRLQKGRDLLRDSLWRELGESFRDLLPGARAWERRGRQLSLLLLAALPARATHAAALAIGRGGLDAGNNPLAATLEAAPSSLTSSALFPGGILVTKLGLVVTATAVLGLGAAMWLLRDAKYSSSPPEAASSAVAGMAEHALLSKYRKAIARQHELEAENVRLRERLEQAVARGDTAKAKPESAAGGAAPDGSSGLEWSDYLRLLAQNVEILDRSFSSTELTEEERASLTALESELLRISARARALSPAPIFDAAIFGELTRALFKHSLGLTDEQFAAVENANRALFDALPEDLDSLSPLERFRLRQEMAHGVWGAVEEVLDGEQRQNWEPVRKYSERLFREGHLTETGLGLERPDIQVFSQLSRAYSLTTEQADSVRPWVPEYILSARQILERHASNQQELEALPSSRRRALEMEFLDLQKRYELQILPLLGGEQRQKVLGAAPQVLYFNCGNGVMGYGYGSGLF